MTQGTCVPASLRRLLEGPAQRRPSVAHASRGCGRGEGAGLLVMEKQTTCSRRGGCAQALSLQLGEQARVAVRPRTGVRAAPGRPDLGMRGGSSAPSVALEVNRGLPVSMAQPGRMEAADQRVPSPSTPGPLGSENRGARPRRHGWGPPERWRRRHPWLRPLCELPAAGAAVSDALTPPTPSLGAPALASAALASPVSRAPASRHPVLPPGELGLGVCGLWGSFP